MSDKFKKASEVIATPEVEALPEVDATQLLNEIEELKKQLAEAKASKKDTTETVATNPRNMNEYLNEKVPYYAFKDNDKYKDDIHVGINGYNYVIQRGVTVMIPRYVKDAIDNAERQNVEAVRHNQNLIDDFMRETKARGIDN